MLFWPVPGVPVTLTVDTQVQLLPLNVGVKVELPPVSQFLTGRFDVVKQLLVVAWLNVGSNPGAIKK
jgi:hypothetical protein